MSVTADVRTLAASGPLDAVKRILDVTLTVAGQSSDPSSWHDTVDLLEHALVVRQDWKADQADTWCRLVMAGIGARDAVTVSIGIHR